MSLLSTFKKMFIVLLYLFLITTIGILLYSERDTISGSSYGDGFIVVPSEDDPLLKSEADYARKSSQYIRNLPLPPYSLGKLRKGPKYFKNSTCARFPTIYDLQFSARIWQVERQMGWTFYLFGAYWDTRRFANKKASTIRVLTLMDRLHQDIKVTYCQIWFDDQRQPLVTKVDEYTFIWIKSMGNAVNGELQPYLLNCPMPQNYKGKMPTSVSIVTSTCKNATNNLRIYYDKPKRKESIAVCVKGLSFIDVDWSVRLVEWIEFIKIMGVSKIFMYDLQNHPNVNKVFQYYEESKDIEVLPLTHPAGIPNDPYLRHLYLKTQIPTVTKARKRQQELIPYNDCLYRNMYKYDYIVVLDTDEIILPHNNASNWPDLLKALENRYNNGTSFPYYTFLDVIFATVDTMEADKEETHIPKYLHMLRHTVRRKVPERKHLGIKCIYRSEEMLILHHHYPICVNDDNCTKVYVDLNDGYLHHHTIDGPGFTKKGKLKGDFSNDYRAWKWKDELINNSNRVLLQLGLIS